MHNIDELLTILKNHEGFRSHSYLDAAGFLTIGFGFKKGDYKELTQAFFDKNYITEKEATEVLEKICLKMWNEISKKINVDVNTNQINALISLCYNIGTNAFINSTLLQKLNNSDFAGASAEFLKWSKITKNGLKVHCAGLFSRRVLEKQLFDKR